MSKYLVSKNRCPLSGDGESLPEKSAVWTSWRTFGL